MPRTPRDSASDPSAFLPLSPAVFHVLVSVAVGDCRGYAIIKEVAVRRAIRGDHLSSVQTEFGQRWTLAGFCIRHNASTCVQ